MPSNCPSCTDGVSTNCPLHKDRSVASFKQTVEDLGLRSPEVPETKGHEGHELIFTSVRGYISTMFPKQADIEWTKPYCLTCRTYV